MKEIAQYLSYTTIRHWENYQLVEKSHIQFGYAKEILNIQNWEKIHAVTNLIQNLQTSIHNEVVLRWIEY